MTDRPHDDRELAIRMLTVDVRRPARSVAVVSLDGEVDMLTAPLITESVEAEFARGLDVVLDLTCVGFLGSHGVAAMYDLDDRADRRGCELCLAGTPTHGIVRVLEITGLGVVMPVVSDPDEAVRTLARRRSA